MKFKKKPLLAASKLNEVVIKIKKQDKPLYLTIINKENQKRYLGVKLN